MRVRLRVRGARRFDFFETFKGEINNLEKIFDILREKKLNLKNILPRLKDCRRGLMDCF